MGGVNPNYAGWLHPCCGAKSPLYGCREGLARILGPFSGADWSDLTGLPIGRFQIQDFSEM